VKDFRGGRQGTLNGCPSINGVQLADKSSELGEKPGAHPATDAPGDRYATDRSADDLKPREIFRVRVQRGTMFPYGRTGPAAASCHQTFPSPP
jgi:hypothetical protein